MEFYIDRTYNTTNTQQISHRMKLQKQLAVQLSSARDSQSEPKRQTSLKCKSGPRQIQTSNL
jgi:hypothetical protein